MRSLLLLLMFCLLAAAAMVWGMGGQTIDTGGSSTGAREDRATDLTGGSVERVVDADPFETVTARNPVDPSSVREVTIHGRCVDAEVGFPLSGCEVTVTATRLFGETYGEPMTVLTGPDGTFEIPVRTAPDYALTISTSIVGRADMTGALAFEEGGVDAGDIPIPAGARLRARVVDPSGQPLQGVGMSFFVPIAARLASIAPVKIIAARSGEGGVIDLDTGMLPGPWRINARGGATLIDPPTLFEIPEGVAEHTIRIVVEPAPADASITGRLVDPDGKPVANRAIHAMDDNILESGLATSESDGSFSIRRRIGQNLRVSLTVLASKGYEALITAPSYAWGDSDVTLTLIPAGDITLSVVTATDSLPVEQFAGRWVVSQPWAIDSGPHRNGEVVLAGVPNGIFLVEIHPEDPHLAKSEVEFTKKPGDTEFRIALESTLELPVEVVFGDGRPVVGTLIGLFDPSPTSTRAFSRNGELATARTNSSGRAQLRIPPTQGPLTIQARGDNHIPLQREDVFVERDSPPLHIVVEKGASVEGTVRPARLVQMMGDNARTVFGSRYPAAGVGPTAVFQYDGERIPNLDPARKTGVVSDDGTFRLSGLRAGVWTAQFRFWGNDGGRGGGPGAHTFGSITLDENETRRVEWDISDLFPASLWGQVFVNGQPAAGKLVHFTWIPQDDNSLLNNSTVILLRTDDNGVFTTDNTRPGRYHISLEIRGEARRQPRLLCTTPVELSPGTKTDHAFRITTGSLSLTVRDSDGQPKKGARVSIRHPSSGFEIHGVADAEGRYRADPMAAGTYAIETEENGTTTWSEFTVSAGPATELVISRK